MHDNLTVAGLADADAAMLKPELKRVTLEPHQVLTPQGAPVDVVYFPITAQLVNRVTFADGRSAETFVMGREGVSGLAPFLADEVCPWSVEVRRGGEAYCIPAPILRRRLEESATLRLQFNRLTSDYQSQAAIGVACAALHDIAARLARYLMELTDREQATTFELTQQDLAQGLGAQRTTINAAATQLKKDGAIAYSRGRLRIVNLGRLRDAACECYSLAPHHGGAA